MNPIYGHLPESKVLDQSGGWKCRLSGIILNSAAEIQGLGAAGWLAIFLVLSYGLGLAGTFSLGKLVAVFAVGLWLALGGVRRIGTCAAFYFGVLALCTALSADRWVSLWGLCGTFNTGLLAAAVLVPYWTSVAASDHKSLERGLRVGAMASAVFGVFQRSCGFWTSEVFGPRAYAVMGSPIYFGALLAMAAPFSVSIPELAVYGFGIWSTGSRGAVLAAGAGVAYRHWRRLPWWLWAAAGVLALGVGMRLRSATSASDTGRLLVWAGAIKTWRAHPVFGLGTGTFLAAAENVRTPAWDLVYGETTQDHAHNLVFEALSSTGIVGLLALSFFCAALWRRSNRGTRAALLAVGFVGLIEPLPMVVKALAIALAASCGNTTDLKPARQLSMAIQIFLCSSFLTLAGLICCDQLVLRYAEAPWSLSSRKAAISLGLIRFRRDVAVTEK